MAEDEGPQYALHVVITTLKDRCKSLQSAVDGLEKENVRLKMQCKRSDVPGTDTDELKERIVKLTEQKAKLRRDTINVTNENRELWGKLSKIVQINKSLGGHLSKINDSLNQHSKRALIRSTTFTQSDADLRTVNKAIAENNRISLELEDVSLKLISNFAKEKSELQAQCSEMEELQRSVGDSLGLAYFNGETDDVVLAESLDRHIAELRLIKDRLDEQNRMFERSLEDVHVAAVLCTCRRGPQSYGRDRADNRNDADDELQLQSLARWGTPENSDDFLRESLKNRCPMCSKEFPHLGMPEFVEHVENHFKLT